MTKEQLGLLMQHFLEWSGGFEPESDQQIRVYIDYAIGVDVDPREAQWALEDWMQINGKIRVAKWN